MWVPIKVVEPHFKGVVSSRFMCSILSRPKDNKIDPEIKLAAVPLCMTVS